jgi:ATP-binding cassette, subfamily B, bacterial
MLPLVSRGLTAALALLTLTQPLLGLAFMFAVGRLVSQLPALVAGESSDWVHTLALVAGIYVAQQAHASAAEIVEWKMGQRLNHYLDDRVMALLLEPTGIAHLESSRIRDLAASVADGLGAGWWRPAKTPAALRSLASAGIGLLLAFGVVVWLEWWLGLALAVAASWALYTVTRHSIDMILGFAGSTGDADFRRMEYERDVAVAPYSAKEVRLFGFASWALSRWEGRLGRVLALDLRNIARLTPGLVVSVAALTAVSAGGFAWAALQAARGELGLAAATILAQAVLAPLVLFGPPGQAAINLTLCAKPIRGLLELERDLEPYRGCAGRDSRRGSAPAERSAGGVRLEGVSFRYPGNDVEVLSDVTLDIPRGTSVAVVGLNGAGKTTLVKLLCGFYEPTKGAITVDGRDLSDYSEGDWQRRVAAIFQDFARYPASAKDNVGFGDLTATRERITHAAERTGAVDFLERLPNGWDTVLSREVTDGADLSGGQWQRVALSRALLAADSRADLLILDEPAANLDIRAEADLNQRFLELTEGVTTVVISHRFSTVRQADRICVLEEGKLIEQGSHDELLARGGRYAGLFQLQAARFGA